MRTLRTCGLLRFVRGQIIVFLLCAAPAISSHAQTLTTPASFNFADGAEPDVALAQGRDGNLYGMTGAGGLNSAGTVFKLDLTTDTLTTLYNFCSQPGCTDGARTPLGGGPLFLATDGNFYGATQGGGLYSGCNNNPGQTCGTVFKVTPGGALTTLHNFKGADGSFPNGVVQGTDGDFYGTAQEGGANNAGTFFKMTRNGTLTTLYNFCSQPSCTDGGAPMSPPIQATDGNFYGTTFVGGAGFGGGTVYKITPKGKSTTLATVGGSPAGALVQGDDGNFYGTAARSGTVFQMTPDGTLTTLGVVGQYAYAGLVQAADGNFYGTVYRQFGTVFAITPEGTVTTPYTFCAQLNCTDGDYPLAGLIQGTDGNLYGATIVGGADTSCNLIQGSSGCGTVFDLSVPGLSPFVEAVTYSGKVGKTIEFLGQGFTKSTTVSFNGTLATRSVKSGTYLTAKVPSGATTGFVTITTSSGTLQSNKMFRVIP
ncbi:MAG TPA: choice-of-anchor tandem repeat GloVer-containing protein [Terriglobales bacterium]|nr:choice-of-anchor tandem repeat GloVer-containing protein [Terriglobales bacterium]